MKFAQKPMATKSAMKMSMLQTARRPSLPMKILRRVDGCALGASSVGGIGSADGKVASFKEAPRVARVYLKVPGGSSESRAVFFEDAEIHHHKDARLASLLRSLLVNHIFLHPDRRDFESNRFVDNFLHKFRTAENIHDVDFDRHVEQRCVRLLAQALIDLRVYREDSISVALHIGRDPVAGAQGIGGEADHGDGLGTHQQVSDGIRLCHESQRSIQLTSCWPDLPSACAFSAPACGLSRKPPYWRKYSSNPRSTGVSSSPVRDRVACADLTPDSAPLCSSS